MPAATVPSLRPTAPTPPCKLVVEAATAGDGCRRRRRRKRRRWWRWRQWWWCGGAEVGR